MNYPYLPRHPEQEPLGTEVRAMLIVLIFAIVVFLIAAFFIGNAGAQEVNPDIVIQIESNWREWAVNRNSGAVGLGQITLIALKDFNQLNGTRYTMQDLKDPQRNMRISYWTLTERIPQLLRWSKIPITLENILAAYNWGINKLKKYGMKKAPKETRDYIKKYARLSQAQR